MLQPLHHYHWYQTANKALSGVALGAVNLGLAAMPCSPIIEDRRYILAFEGELYNRDELRQHNAPETEPANGQSHSTLEGEDATLVLQALRRWGTRALNRFNGIFQLVWWDKQEHELLLASDRGGLRPLYFTQFQDSFAFAPEVKAFLALPSFSRTLDFQGIHSFLQFGFPVNDRTFFENVKVLPPGSWARFHRGRLHLERYWRMQYQEQTATSVQTAREQFLETWRDVLQRQTATNARLGTLLSGGLDTRLILAGLTKHGKHVPTFTFGAPASKDFQIAQRVAHTAQCANLSSPILPASIANGFEHTVYLTDGLYNCFHANMRYLLPSLAKTVDLIFDGISPLDSNYYRIQMPFIRWRSRNDRSHWLRQIYHHWMPGDLRTFRLSPRERINLFASSFNGMDGSEDYLDTFVRTTTGNSYGPLSLSELFDFEEYGRRFAAFGPYLLRTVINVRCPFYDREILELAGQLPPSLRCKEKLLHKFAIQQLAPALAKIPTDRSPLPLTAGIGRTHLHLGARYLARQAQTLREFCFAQAAPDAGSPPMLDYNDLLRTTPTFLHLVRHYLLDDWENGSQFFNRRSAQTLLEHHLQKKGNHADLLGRLLTLELWHRLFVGNTATLQVPRLDFQQPLAAEVL